MKTFADKRAKASLANLKQCEVVLVKQTQLKKLSTPFASTPLVVSDTKGSTITAQREDRSSVTRNASMFSRVKLPPEPPDDVPTTDGARSDTLNSSDGVAKK